MYFSVNTSCKGMMQKREYSMHTSTRYKNQDNKKNNKKLPELYDNRENCCGCSACYSICPIGAIIMESDEEGFFYPIVDAEKCICCYRCLSVCAFKIDQKERGFYD